MKQKLNILLMVVAFSLAAVADDHIHFVGHNSFKPSMDWNMEFSTPLEVMAFESKQTAISNNLTKHTVQYSILKNGKHTGCTMKTSEVLNPSSAIYTAKIKFSKLPPEGQVKSKTLTLTGRWNADQTLIGPDLTTMDLSKITDEGQIAHTRITCMKPVSAESQDPIDSSMTDLKTMGLIAFNKETGKAASYNKISDTLSLKRGKHYSALNSALNINLKAAREQK